MLSRAHQFDAALAALQKAQELDRKLGEIYSRRGKIFEAQGRKEQARNEYVAGIKVDPKYPHLRTNLVGWLAGKNDLEGAFKVADELIAALPDSCEGYNAKGFCDLQPNDIPHALEYFDKAIKLAPDEPRPYMNRAAAKSKQGNKVGAQLDGLHSHRRAPDDFNILFEAAIHCDAARDYKQAIRLLNKAHFIVPTNVPALLKRGILHARYFAADNAIDDLTEVLRLDPKEAQAPMWRAAMQVFQGNETEAEQDAKICVQLDASLEGRLNYLMANFREHRKTRQPLPKSDPNEFE